jgi:hypothetical protein
MALCIRVTLNARHDRTPESPRVETTIGLTGIERQYLFTSDTDRRLAPTQELQIID